MSQTARKPKEEAFEGTDKFLEFTISGSYYNSKKETVDFDGVKGRIPFCDEENGVGSMHVRGRYAAKWIRETLDANGEKKYPDRINKLRQVFVDEVVEVPGTYSFVGKDIKTLTVDEMQELAVAKDLRFIPVPDAGYDLRDMRVRTYVSYSEKVLRQKVEYQKEEFNFAELPSIILDGKPRREEGQKISNEEIIQQEQNATKPVPMGEKDDPRNRFTLRELKELADSKNIQYTEGVEFEELYTQLFSS